MAGPWEKYAQSQTASQPEGPWTKYQTPTVSGPSKAESAIRGAASGFTASFDDEIIGAIGGAGRVFGIKNLGSWKPFDPNSKIEMADEPLSADEIVKAYQSNRDAIRSDQRQDFEINPAATIAGNLAGAVVSPASKLVASQKVFGPLSKAQAFGQTMKTAALQGSVFGAGASEADLTKGDLGEAISDTATGAAIGGAIPPAIKAAGYGIKKGAQLAGWTGKKAFSGIFGVNEQNASKYLARRKEVNAAPELEQIKTQVDDAVKAISDDVESGKISTQQAKEAVNELRQQLRNNLTDAKYEAREAVRKTEDLFKESAAKLIQPLKDIKAPTDKASEVSEMVAQLKSKVRGLSGEALETLNNSDKKIDLGTVFSEIDNTIAKLKESGTDEALSIAENLKRYKKRLLVNNETKQVGFQPSGKIETLKPAVFENEAKLNAPGTLKPARWIVGHNEDQWQKTGLLGKQVVPPVEFQPIGPRYGVEAKIKAASAKKLIQGLDQITEYSPMAGAFDKAKSSSFKGVRSTLDKSLKESVPEYRAKMADLAPDTALLDDANAAFGTPELAVGKLGRMNTPRGEFDRATLAKLENAVSKPGSVTTEVDKFSRAQKILKDPQVLEKMRRSLPEYAAYRQAMAKLAKMKPEWSRDQLEHALSTSKEARALSFAEDALAKAKAKLDPVASLRPESTEAKLKAFIRPSGASIETRKAFEALEKQTGKKFIQSIEDRAVLDAFEKGNTNGSRNTLFWGLVGAITGGIPGALGGAAFGHQVIDKYGPKLGKRILDAIGKIQENPTVQTVRGLNLPTEVKAEIEREFRVLMLIRNGAENTAPRRVAGSEPDRKPAVLKGPDAWAQRGIEKLGLSGNPAAEKILSSKEGKQLLIEASDLDPKSKAMQKIKEKLQKGWGVK